MQAFSSIYLVLISSNLARNYYCVIFLSSTSVFSFFISSTYLFFMRSSLNFSIYSICSSWMLPDKNFFICPVWSKELIGLSELAGIFEFCSIFSIFCSLLCYSLKNIALSDRTILSFFLSDLMGSKYAVSLADSMGIWLISIFLSFSLSKWAS